MGKIALYNGLDTSFDQELWEINGATAVEITPSLNSGQGGLNPRYLTPFNGKVLFEGTNASGVQGLWITNATAAGTYELSGISGANPTGLLPSHMTVYNGEVLFEGMAGVAGDDVPGLWVTNGTVAGTYELGGSANVGINNVYSGGFLLLGNPDFTPFNGITLFDGRDSANNIGLWETNGTVSGTFELAPIAGAAAVGSPGSDVQPQYMAVLGGEVLFDGADQQDTPGSLWITDGTAGGTTEIGGQGNAGIAGSPNGFTGQYTSELPMGIQPDDLTTFNGRVLFAGYDNTLDPSGYYARTEALWTTDGTAAGTSEIGGLGNAQISGANSAQNGGIFWAGSIEYPDFTVYGGIALFMGYDSNGHVGLWETDGTAAGTKEIGGLGNAGISGGLSLLNTENPDFTVYDGKVLFNGLDGSGHSGVWVTDGTAAGTHELSTPNLGEPNAVLGPEFTLYGASVSHDFVGDGVSDIIWQFNGASTYEWDMLGGQHVGNVSLGNLSSYSLIGTGDFNGDGTSDLLWQSSSTGATYIWTMTNGQHTGNVFLGNLSGWTASVGDFNGDGTSDIIWQYGATGATYEWTMNGDQDTANTYLGNLNTFSIVGVGDFTGNGTSDLLWKSQTSGEVYEWTMTNGQHTGNVDLGNLNGWNEIGTGDFTGNGTSDILWQYAATGDVWEWTMSNGQHTGNIYLGNLNTYSVAGVGDYTGSGTDGILWQSQTSGEVYEWTMTNGQHTGNVDLGNLAGGWKGK